MLLKYEWREYKKGIQYPYINTTGIEENFKHKRGKNRRGVVLEFNFFQR